jgi:xylulokinase
VPLDARGEPTAEVIAWFDTRTRRRPSGSIGPSARTPCSPAPASRSSRSFPCASCSGSEMSGRSMGRTTRWLMAADYLAWRLCGVAATDHSLASRTLMLNLHTLEWDRETLGAVGIDEDLLAPLARVGRRSITSRRGGPGDWSARDLRRGTGGHDHVCGRSPQASPSRGNAQLARHGRSGLHAARPAADRPGGGPPGLHPGRHVVGGRPTSFAGQYTSGACVGLGRDLVGRGEAYETLLPRRPRHLRAASASRSCRTCVG